MRGGEREGRGRGEGGEREGRGRGEGGEREGRGKGRCLYLRKALWSRILSSAGLINFLNIDRNIMFI